jgi:hypothetical protein
MNKPKKADDFSLSRDISVQIKCQKIKTGKMEENGEKIEIGFGEK